MGLITAQRHRSVARPLSSSLGGGGQVQARLQRPESRVGPKRSQSRILGDAHDRGFAARKGCFKEGDRGAGVDHSLALREGVRRPLPGVELRPPDGQDRACRSRRAALGQPALRRGAVYVRFATRRRESRT